MKQRAIIAKATIAELEVLYNHYNELSKFCRDCIKNLLSSGGADCEITVSMPGQPDVTTALTSVPPNASLFFFVQLGDNYDAMLSAVSDELYLKKLTRQVEPSSSYGR